MRLSARYLALLLPLCMASLAIAQYPRLIFNTTCPADNSVNLCCYDTDSFTLSCGTGTGQTTFPGMVGGTGTAGRVARFASGGINLENSSLFSDPVTGNLGLDTTVPAVALHIVADNTFAKESIQQDVYRDSSGGPGSTTRKARGTLAAPVRLNVNDVMGILNQSFGYVRNAADLADEFTQLAIVRTAVESVDAQGRAGANFSIFLSPGVSAPTALKFRVTEAGNLIQGTTAAVGTGGTNTFVQGPGVFPSTSPPDTVQWTAIDRGGTAGKRSLALRTEDGTSHILGDRVGIGTITPGTFMEVAGTLNVSNAGEIQSAGVRVGHNLSVYAAGTAYSLTNVAALLNFGTTDPQLVINQPGTYLLMPRVALRYNAATFAANQTVTLKVRRTNNTAADVANSTITLTTRILTTITDHMAVATFPTLLYPTANSNDALELQGSVSVVPSAGSLDVYEASLIAVRLY